MALIQFFCRLTAYDGNEPRHICGGVVSTVNGVSSHHLGLWPGVKELEVID